MAKVKKEIDKELMYKKLMPSNFKPSKTAFQEKTEEVPTIQQPEPGQDLPDSQRKISQRVVNIPVIDGQKTVLVNLMENVVFEKFDSVMARFNCCRCDRCKKDIIALSLNKLPPKYTVLIQGEILPEIDKQLSAQVLTAMIQSVLQVRAHPRH